MKKKKMEIPKEKLRIFDNIVDSGGNKCGNEFMEAIGENFTEEQRFRLWEESGGCNGGNKYDNERKAFAAEHTDKPLSERLELYKNTLGKKLSPEKTLDIVLDEKTGTITTTFACDECYKRSIKGITTAPVTLYYESCAGGRMSYLTKALEINLKIKSVYIPPNGISKENPCVYTFEIVG